MGVSYFIFSILDIAILAGGYTMKLDANGEYICLDEWYFASTSNYAAVFIFLEQLIFYLFSVSSWYTYYRLPDKYGLIGNTSVQDLKMRTNSSHNSTIQG